MNSSILHSFHNESHDDLLMTGVYTITSKSTGRIYVGSASQINGSYSNDIGFHRRWRRHIYELSNNNHNNKFLQSHVNKYGLNDLLFEIIEIYDPEICEHMELYWINMLDTVKDGFNLTYHTKLSRGKSHPAYKKLNDNSIIEEYNNGKSIRSISKMFNCSTKKISSVLKENNIIVANKNFYSKEIFTEIYNDYISSNISLEKIGLKYGIDRGTIAKYFKLNGFLSKKELKK